MHVLHVVEGPERGRTFRLPPDEPQLIGRSSEALPISDHAVSRRQAELTPDGGAWYLRDLESANGTFVNGTAIVGRVRLAPGDEIRCGSTVMRFASEPDREPPSPISLLGPDEIDHAVTSHIGPDEPASAAGSASGGADALRIAGEHLRVIYELTATTATALTAEELLPRVLDMVFREFDPERGFILLAPEGSTRLLPAAVRYRTRPRTVAEGEIPVSRTIVQHVLQRAEGVLSTNAMTDQRFRSGDSVQAYGIRTAICVPIRSGRRVLGVIHIDSSLADFRWAEPELRLLGHIGQHVGLALEGAAAVASMMQRERLAAMGDTVATLSHSIKNILQGLRGGADAVELSLARGDLEAAREGWPILSRNLDRILALTLNMLVWSKPRSLDIELVAVGPLLREVIELVQPHAQRRSVSIALDLDPAMPPIPLDLNAMHQALTNLVGNAIDAAPDRRGRVVIRARHDPASESAEIAVIDNGEGIPAEIRDRIFEPFVSSKGQRGTGLGLAVTRKIAEEHGGAVGVQSEPGRGSTFSIILPLRLPEEEKGRTQAPRPGRDALEGELE
ncbi:MAG TPA: ATP-binding protein [Phycisphaerales bacterium]|nr:ATP-binding protein [Phycisphaerales bacterium]HMP38035.1 ATP-binding protein [Phycisphaerales bacterium]